MSFQDFLKQRNLPNVGPLVDAGYIWGNISTTDQTYVSIYWDRVTPRQIARLRETLKQLGIPDSAQCEVRTKQQTIRTPVGQLAPIKPQRVSKRKPSVQALAADHANVDVLDDDLSGNTLSRVVWERTSTIETHELNVVSLDDYPGVYAVHVGDPEFWFYRLIHDYANDHTAWVIEIKPARGDVLVEDVRYSIPDESGNKGYSAILLTTRSLLREGKDFTYGQELKYDQDSDPISNDDPIY